MQATSTAIIPVSGCSKLICFLLLVQIGSNELIGTSFICTPKKQKAVQTAADNKESIIKVRNRDRNNVLKATQYNSINIHSSICIYAPRNTTLIHFIGFFSPS